MANLARVQKNAGISEQKLQEEKNHLLALLSAYRLDDAKLKNITKHMTKKEIRGLAAEMEKSAKKFKGYSVHLE